MNSNGWSVIADEYAQREARVRAALGGRAHGKTLERAVAELVEENRLLYRWNAELREQMPTAEPQPRQETPITLDSSWTSGT